MPHTPSSFARRLPAALLAFVGLAVAAYLGGSQSGWWTAWEPLFGNGSALVLHSSFSRALPVPDAWLGAGAYLVEFVLELSGSDTRWLEQPLVAGINMALVAAMAIGSAGLVAAQGLFFHAWCTLCLASAACSFAIAVLSWPEMRAVSSRALPRRT